MNQTKPMGYFCKISLALLCLTALALIHSSHAQNSPQDYLNAHNAARAQVGVGPMRWDNNLANYARNYANRRIGDCNLVHSGGPYGENLAKGSGDFTGTSAVRLWVNEKRYYNYNSNSCANGKVCGHYTQVVWRKSVRLGCARVRCNSGWFYIICSYDPRGNIIGQRPYDELTSSIDPSSNNNGQRPDDEQDTDEELTSSIDPSSNNNGQLPDEDPTSSI